MLRTFNEIPNIIIYKQKKDSGISKHLLAKQRCFMYNAHIPERLDIIHHY